MTASTSQPGNLSTAALQFDTHSTVLRVRWLAICGIVMQAGILGFVSGARLFPISVSVLAIIAGVTPWRITQTLPTLAAPYQ